MLFRSGRSFLGRFQHHSAAQMVQVLDLDIEVELVGYGPIWDDFFVSVGFSSVATLH